MTEINFDNSYARLSEAFFERAHPKKPPNPSLIRVNEKLAEFLGLNHEWLLSEEGLSMLSGRSLPAGADPIAMAYAGNQFGNPLVKLGDGRALLLGEVIAKDGIRHDIQLKGSGKTPFSRSGDGKAALGSVMREYIASEAMAALGVPTTRALSVSTTGEDVYKHEKLQPAAVFARVAKSHIRIGTFQYFQEQGNKKALKALADYVIDRYYPEAKEDKQPYQALLRGVAKKQAVLIAQWMSLGFIHGVMNTDNVQIAGETIDYGPCAFMDDFHPQKTFSSIDRESRYAWDQQPVMALWNLERLAETLQPLISENQEHARKITADALLDFNESFSESFFKIVRQKLGLLEDREAYKGFIEKTFETMAENEVDFTLFFRQLTRIASGGGKDGFYELFKNPREGYKWLKTWQEQLSEEEIPQENRVATMRQSNPVFIPRNHRVEEAIQAALKKDYVPFHRLVKVLEHPFDEQAEHSDLEKPPRSNQVVCETFCGT